MNIFNGYYLDYYVDQSLYLYMQQFTNKNVELYNNKYVKTILQPNKKYILPIGLFSNQDIVLQCKWKDSNRVFINKIENISSNLILKKNQELIIKEFFKHKKIIYEINKAPIYLNLVGHCSIGKTIIAIHLISELKLKTFIITPSLDLAKQWGKEINKFLNVSYYVSLDGVKSFLNNNKAYDIICFPYKHLTNITFHSYLMENYSMGIIDEQHKYNLETNDVLQYFLTFCSFSVFISLTATPRKSNCLYLGKEININKFSNTNTFDKIAYEIISNNYKNVKDYSTEYLAYKQLKHNNIFIPNKPLLLSIYKKRACASDNFRNQIILKYIVESFTENSKILILTKFVEDIDKFYNLLKKHISEIYINKIYAIDKNNDKTLAKVKQKLKMYTKYIIIGTEDHLGTGIDIVELNVLHITSFTSNSRNIIQYAGRVSRENDSKIHYIYYYNISSLKEINIDNEINIIRKTLSDNRWTCIAKKYIY